MKKTKKKKKRIFLPIIIIVLLFSATGLFANNYYRAEDIAITAMAQNNSYTVTGDNGNLIFTPDEPIAGLIFYPGGKVEHAAYAPLMAKLAENGVLCVLIQMPLKLAVLDVDAAAGIQERYPDITNWYIGGHSLGGAMAAVYVSENTQSFNGLMLLGAYSTVDLSKSGLDVISVYGSEDNIMNREKYDANIGNLPQNFKEYVIAGGCHSYFGYYGLQKGDGTPTVTQDEQIQKTAECFFAMADRYLP